MGEAGAEQQAAADQAEGLIHPDVEPFCHVAEFEQSDDVDQKKEGKKAPGVYVNTGGQYPDEQDSADGPFSEIIHDTWILGWMQLFPGLRF